MRSWLAPFCASVRSTRWSRWRGPTRHIVPTKTVVVVGDDGTRSLTEMRWGLIPSWAKDSTMGNLLINYW